MLRFVALSSQVLLNVIAEELIVAKIYFELTVCQVCYKVNNLLELKAVRGGLSSSIVEFTQLSKFHQLC